MIKTRHILTIVEVADLLNCSTLQVKRFSQEYETFPPTLVITKGRRYWAKDEIEIWKRARVPDLFDDLEKATNDEGKT
jgi:predicted DNA-binding transcriptional regulator AlpA